MKHVFIINPAAGKSDSTLRLTTEIEQIFSQLSEPYKIEITGYPGHAGRIAQRYASGMADGEETVLYACGGDGTISEVAQALYDSPQVILAPVPTGTGNDFVRGLAGGADGISDFSVASLACGRVVSADMLKAGGHVALNIVSVGLDASIAKNVAKFKHIPFINGQTAYGMSTAYSFLSRTSYNCRFEIDGELTPPEDFVFALAANGRYYGGGFKAAPLADIQDGLIDFIRIPAMPRHKMLPMIGSFKRGEHLDKYNFAKLHRCRCIRILSDEPVALNCDGEVVETMNPTIEIVPLGMRLMLPKNYAERRETAYRSATMIR